MIKVFHVAESVKGGIQSYLEDLDGELHALGVENHYILPHEIDIKSKNISIIKSKRKIIGLILYVYELFKVFYNEKPDVIHIHSTISGVAVRILKLFGVVKSRIIYQPHGWSYIRDDGAATHIYKILESFLSLATDAFVVISKFEYPEFKS